jgi:hypothetical protein
LLLRVHHHPGGLSEYIAKCTGGLESGMLIVAFSYVEKLVEDGGFCCLLPGLYVEPV